MPRFFLVHQGEERMVKVPEFIAMKGIAEIIGRSSSTAWRYSRQADFPKPLYLTSSSPVWVKDEVVQWLLNRPNRPTA